MSLGHPDDGGRRWETAVQYVWGTDVDYRLILAFRRTEGWELAGADFGSYWDESRHAIRERLSLYFSRPARAGLWARYVLNGLEPTWIQMEKPQEQALTRGGTER